MALDFQPIYILASGLFYRQRELEVVANNLANVDTPGFKRVLLTAMAYPVKSPKEVLLTTPPDSPKRSENNFVYTVMGKQKVDTTEGPLEHTGNPLDVAISGKGFFAVEVKGKVLYTRDGHFLLDPQGYLVNQNGYPVLDSSGRKILIGRAPLEEVKITRDGVIFVGNRRVAKLKIVDLEGVKHVGENLYRGEREKPAVDYTVLQGYLEGSNVNPVEEMVRMTQTMRAYQAVANALKSIDTVNGNLINGILKV